MYINGHDVCYMVVDENGVFKEDNFNKAIGLIETEYDLETVLNKKKDSKSKPI